MIINFHRFVIVRNEKGKNLSIQFFLTFYRFKKFDKSSDSDDHVMRILTINDVKNNSAALHFANEKKKIHSRCRHEINNYFEVKFTHEQFQFVLSFLNEHKSPKSHEKIKL